MDSESTTAASIRAALRGSAGRSVTTWKASEPGSIERKTAAALDELAARNWDVSRTAFLDVGGADGALLENILRRTPARYGVMLEYDDDASLKAHERARHLDDGKTMRVFTGDATQKIAPALAQLTSWRRDGLIDGMCVTLYAVLHELTERGSGTDDLVGFLYKLIWQMPTVVIAREPCVPASLPHEVYLSASGCPATLLADLAARIQSAHPSAFTGVVQAMNDRVRMQGRLAIETAIKIFYIEDFDYELNERVTSYADADLLRAFYHVFGAECVRHDNLQSDSFDRRWADLGLKLYADGQELAKPQLHIKITAHHEGGTDEELDPGPPKSASDHGREKGALLADSTTTDSSETAAAELEPPETPTTETGRPVRRGSYPGPARNADEGGSPHSLHESIVEMLKVEFGRGNYSDVIRIGDALSRPLFETGAFSVRLEVGRMVEEAAARSSRKREQYVALIDSIGWSLVELGRYEAGARHIKHGLRLLKSVSDPFYEAKAHRHLGVIARRERRYTEARTEYAEAHECSSRIADARDGLIMTAGLQYALGSLSYYEQDFDGAATEINNAIHSFESLGDEYRLNMALVMRGDIEFRQGEPDEARDTYRLVLQNADRNRETLQYVRACLGLADVWTAEGEWNEVHDALSLLSGLDLQQYKAERDRLNALRSGIPDEQIDDRAS